METEFLLIDFILNTIVTLSSTLPNKNLYNALVVIHLRFKETKKLEIPNDLIELINNCFDANFMNADLRNDIILFFSKMSLSYLDEYKCLILSLICKIHAKCEVMKLLTQQNKTSEINKMEQLLLEAPRFLEDGDLVQNCNINDVLYLLCLTIKNTHDLNSGCLFLKYYHNTFEPVVPNLPNNSTELLMFVRRTIVDTADAFILMSRMFKPLEKVFNQKEGLNISELQTQIDRISSEVQTSMSRFYQSPESNSTAHSESSNAASEVKTVINDASHDIMREIDHLTSTIMHITADDKITPEEKAMLDNVSTDVSNNVKDIVDQTVSDVKDIVDEEIVSIPTPVPTSSEVKKPVDVKNFSKEDIETLIADYKKMALNMRASKS